MNRHMYETLSRFCTARQSKHSNKKKLANNMNKSITKGNTNGSKIVEKIPRFPHNKQI